MACGQGRGGVSGFQHPAVTRHQTKDLHTSALGQSGCPAEGTQLELEMSLGKLLVLGSGGTPSSSPRPGTDLCSPPNCKGPGATCVPNWSLHSPVLALGLGGR